MVILQASLKINGNIARLVGESRRKSYIVLKNDSPCMILVEGGSHGLKLYAILRQWKAVFAVAW